MKFITEIELRDLYKTNPFATYQLQPNARLTPGAKQFLTDKRVRIEEAAATQASSKDQPSRSLVAPIGSGNSLLTLMQLNDTAVLKQLEGSLLELEQAVRETYWDEQQKTCTRQDLLEKINWVKTIVRLIVNQCLGGEKCNR